MLLLPAWLTPAVKLCVAPAEVVLHCCQLQSQKQLLLLKGQQPLLCQCRMQCCVRQSAVCCWLGVRYLSSCMRGVRYTPGHVTATVAGTVLTVCVPHCVCLTVCVDNGDVCVACRYGPSLRERDPDAFEQMRLVVGYYDLPQVC